MRKIFIFLILILSIMFVGVNFISISEAVTNDEKSLKSTTSALLNDVDYTSLLGKYYNYGVYTKKTNIYLIDNVSIDLSPYFHGKVDKERTTYYNGDYLLMGDLDGGFDDINSGYRNSENDIKHFTYQNESVIDDYIIKDSNIHSFYVTMSKLKESDYLDSSWENGEHIVTSEDDKYLADFLAFTAPCLKADVLTSGYLSYLGMKLKIEELTNSFDKYLSLKMYVSSINSSRVESDLLLSEARIYKDNVCFDDSNLKPIQPGDIVSNSIVYTEAEDSLEGLSEEEIKDLSELKEAVERIGSNYISKSKVFFNKLSSNIVNELYFTNFYCQQTTYVTENYLYRYSRDLTIEEGYVDYKNQVYQVSLDGDNLKEKLNSTINIAALSLIEGLNSIKDMFFTLDKFDSTYIDNTGYAKVAYTSGGKKYYNEYFGWERISHNKYKCDRKEVIEDFMNICSPGFSNGGTYMTFTHVTVEIEPGDDTLLRLRLYTSSTQIGKLISSHTTKQKPNWYLLFAEACITSVDETSIIAFENLFN